TGDYVAVIQGSAHAITPGEVSVEAVVFAPAICFRGSTLGSTGSIDIWTLSEQGIASKLGFTISAIDTADVVGAHFTNNCQAARTHHAVDKVYCAHSSLPELLTLVTANLCARSISCRVRVPMSVITTEP